MLFCYKIFLFLHLNAPKVPDLSVYKGVSYNLTY